MALVDLAWKAWDDTRLAAVRAKGQWLALLNEDGEPLWELPAVTEMKWPESRGVAESVSLTVPVRTDTGGVHPIVAELVADGLGAVDEVGALIPVTGPARLVALERSDDGSVVGWEERRTMRVTHVAAIGDAHAPHTLKIFGVDILCYLDLLPAPSLPTAWEEAEFTRFTRDWIGGEEGGELFEQPRDLAAISLMNAADGGTISGPALEMIEGLLRDSFAAIYSLTGVEREPYAVHVSKPGDTDFLMLRPTDQSLWAEVGEAAITSGVTLGARLHWPRDEVVPGVSTKHAQIVFTMEVT